MWGSIAWIVIIFIVLCVCVYAVYLYFVHRKYDHVPGPKRDSFWLGNLPSIAKSFDSGSTLYEYIHENYEKYGKIFKITIFHTTFIVTSEPEAVKELLVSGRHPKPKSFRDTLFSVFGQRFLGDGLVTETNHEKWLHRRNLMNPCFQRSYLRNLMAEFNTGVDVLMNKLTQLADGKTKVPLLKQFSLTTMDVLAKIAFGMDLNSLQNEDNSFSQAIALSFIGNNEYQKRRHMVLNPTKWKFIWEVRKAIQLMRSFGTKILKERTEAKGRGDYIPDDILTHIVKIKEENPDLEDEIILDDFVTFFIGGQETTATLVGFMVIALCKHPEIYKKLQTEIDDIIGEKSVIEHDDLLKLNYLDNVVKETLRLYPPIPVTSRELVKDTVIGGIKLPVGSNIMVSSYTSARMEDYFDDPLEFDPSRFSADSSKRVNTFTYFPFSLGPRTCIGKFFADIEAKLIMAKLLQRFDIQLDPDQTFRFADTTILKPRSGVICTITLRH